MKYYWPIFGFGIERKNQEIEQEKISSPRTYEFFIGN